MKNQKLQEKGIPPNPGSSSSIPSSNRRSRWDSAEPKNPSSNVFHGRFGPPDDLSPPGAYRDLPRLDLEPPPPLQPYGFQDLERRTIVLADGSFRSYFALPPDPPLNPPRQEGDGLLGHAPTEGISKRKYDEQLQFVHRGNDLEFAGRPNSHYRDEGNDLRSSKHSKVGGEGYDRGRSSGHYKEELNDLRLPKHAKIGDDGFEGSSRRSRGDGDSSAAAIDVNPDAVNRAFLRLSRMIYEDPLTKKNLLEGGKDKPLSCLACGRASKNFGDIHALIMHAYHSHNVDLRIDHLGLHKALCVLMGWDFERVPDTSKAYQSLPSEIAIRNREDLILWPPMLIIQIAESGQKKDGMGSKEIDVKLKDLGIVGGRPKMIGAGMAAVRFAEDKNGLREAERAAERLERDSRGRRAWARASQGSSQRRPGGEKKGDALYGYLAVAADLESLDEEWRKRAVLRSRRDLCK
ncbi:RNA recognition motif XS domain protein [Wolffia australiana]